MHSNYVLKRLLQIIPTFLAVMLVVFLLVRLLPGDPASAILGDRATADIVERTNRQLGLDQPLPTQFALFVWNLLQGNLGDSISLKVPVLRLIGERLPVTLFLTVYAAALGLLLAVPLAVLAAVRRNTWVDALIRGVFQVGLSLPVFYVALQLLTLLGARLGWFPIGGYGSGTLGHLYHLFLPALTLGLNLAAVLVRTLRSSVIEVITAEYVEFARAKGLRPRLIMTRHVLRNALIPTVTLLGLNIGALIGGAVITETVFAIPGVGRLMVDAIFGRDYPVIQGLTLTFAVIVSLVFLLTDLIHARLDPRTELS
ncbi:peptide ABC transporter permease [Deinococcus arenae]|uniref:Peptide ABC transporter permease n=1 Tax=Deinococcus arenae TaxID=1452751 RepID=A0A8H9GY35_9DEIO|nr:MULTISPECIES: ABC transporter permease [Deinococcus]AWT37524.1 ABC transporter permease [Deinococcus actinosclerus]GGM56105.1 peptide ABC transporter permease [Deinococcus arenae]